jgi:hypothetical protein
MSQPFPLRSPSERTLGIVFFPRLVDKIRLAAQGQLPAGYHLGLLPTGRTFDDRFCKFLQIDFSQLQARVLQGGTEEELMEWCFSIGLRPSEEQIEIWNTFLLKRGWNDSGSATLAQQKTAAGLAHRDDIVTYFQLMDAEEGRTA